MNTNGCTTNLELADSLPDNQSIPVPRPTTAHQLTVLGAVLVPPFALIATIIHLWGWGIGLWELLVFLTMYALTGMGITIGYHRLFTHRSFETLRPIKLAFGVLGSMAVQGPLFTWVAMHRRHHQHSDKPDDPHSPHRFGGGIRGALAGFWHAHIGWLFRPDPSGLDRYIPDLKASRSLTVVSRMFGLWVALGLLIPAVLTGLLTRSWAGVWLGFVWGGLARIFLVHHITWSINSVCHLWGRRPFEGRDRSTNNFICGVLAFGEGWHNNHHAFPTSARHGLRWWQLDSSYLVIRLMQFLGLAWRVKTPTREDIMAKRTRRGAQAETSLAAAT